MRLENIPSNAAFTGILDDYLLKGLNSGKETGCSKEHEIKIKIEESKKVSPVSYLYYSKKGRFVEMYSQGEKMDLMA